jgi:hypothetical protein
MGSEGFRMPFDGREFLGKPFHPALNGTLVGFQPRIVDNQLRFLCHCGKVDESPDTRKGKSTGSETLDCGESRQAHHRFGGGVGLRIAVGSHHGVCPRSGLLPMLHLPEKRTRHPQSGDARRSPKFCIRNEVIAPGRRSFSPRHSDRHRAVRWGWRGGLR